MKEILDIFIKATEHLSGSSYPTLSAQFPYFSVLASRLENIVDQERGSIFHDACTASWVKLDEYHSKIGALQAIATILDPRCKMQTFKHLGWRIEWIRDAEVGLRQSYNNLYAPKPSLCESSSSPTLPSHSSYLEDDFRTAVFGTPNSKGTSVISQLDTYLAEKVEPPEVNPVGWWKTYESRFPNLGRMARDYLAVPTSGNKCTF